MKRIIYITIACAFLSVSFAKAQVLTLKECLEEGLQNNYSLRIIHNEEQISKNNATLGNAGYHRAYTWRRVVRPTHRSWP